jgi:hypothetical protein
MGFWAPLSALGKLILRVQKPFQTEIYIVVPARNHSIDLEFCNYLS